MGGRQWSVNNNNEKDLKVKQTLNNNNSNKNNKISQQQQNNKKNKKNNSESIQVVAKINPGIILGSQVGLSTIVILTLFLI